MNSAPEAPEVPDSSADQLRGFEIVRWDAIYRVWTVVGKYRPTELAVRQAAADLKWFKGRHPDAAYEMRAVVSVKHGTHALPQSEQPTLTPTSAPLTDAPREALILESDYDEPAEGNAGDE